ncbi:hypothetical protein HAX54_038682 [Datura stramonium]|uniref:Uncharacterized protein n=1 Tax=Datura stramonium TaxID=4076 RepID=A0ABS8VP47_DATST|nr:hypothetical protein [Datura stramonium]
MRFDDLTNLTRDQVPWSQSQLHNCKAAITTVKLLSLLQRHSNSRTAGTRYEGPGEGPGMHTWYLHYWMSKETVGEPGTVLDLQRESAQLKVENTALRKQLENRCA